MERGVYFDGWYKHNHCYHPSLPLRSRQMLEDLEACHGTVLAWAGLGAAASACLIWSTRPSVPWIRGCRSTDS